MACQAPAHHTHKHTIAKQTGTTQVPNARILVSWIVKQDRACSTPIGAFLCTQAHTHVRTQQRGKVLTHLHCPPPHARKRTEEFHYPLPLAVWSILNLLPKAPWMWQCHWRGGGGGCLAGCDPEAC